MPLTRAALKDIFGDAALECAQSLVEAGRLAYDVAKDEWRLNIARTTSQQNDCKFSIRSVDNEIVQVVIERTGVVVEEVEKSRAFFMVHPGAVYLHNGETYVVTDVDLKRWVATIKPADSRLLYHTCCRDHTKVYLGGQLKNRTLWESNGNNDDGPTLRFGNVRVVMTVSQKAHSHRRDTGYRRPRSPAKRIRVPSTLARRAACVPLWTVG